MNIFKNRTLTALLFIAFMATGAFSIVTNVTGGTYGATFANALVSDICGNGNCFIEQNDPVTESGTSGGSVANLVTSTNVPPIGGCLLQINKTADRTSAVPGDQIVFTINFKNAGTGKCTGSGVHVQDRLDQYLSFVSETHTPNMTGGHDESLPTLPTDTEPHTELYPYNATNNYVDWNAYVLYPGESGQVTVTTLVKPVPYCSYYLINQGLITATQYAWGWIASTGVGVTIDGCVPPPPPQCTLDLTQDQISWTTQNAFTALIKPLTNSPEVPGITLPGTTTLVPHTEGELFENQYVKLDLLVNGGVVFNETAFVGRTFAADQTTMNRVCYVLNGTDAVAKNIGARTYNSCSNNGIIRYQNGAWESVSGCVGAHLSGSFSCEVPTASIQTHPLNGSHSFVPPLPYGTHTYQLTATGSGGTVQCEKTITIEEPKKCELEITKSADTTDAVPGDTIEYTLNFKNIGTKTCTGSGVKIADVMDSRLTYQSETHSANVAAGYQSDPIYTSADRTLRWNAWDLDPNETGWVKFKAKAGTPTQCSAIVPNKAKISSYEYNNFDTWVESNVVNVTIEKDCTPPPPEECKLEITKSANKTTAVAGNAVEYTLSFKNAGNKKCTGSGVKLIDVVDPNIAYQSETHSANVAAGYQSDPVYTSSTRALIWNAWDLDPNETGWVKWIGKFGTPDLCSIVVPNKAKISSYEYNNFGTWIESNIVNVALTKDCTPPPPTCELMVSKKMCSPNESVVLEWVTLNATSLTIDQGIGSVTPVAYGTKNVYPTDTITYTGTVEGPGGSAQCDVTVIVQKPKVPVCTLSASDHSITEGDSVTLSWTSANVSTGSINQGVGDASPVAAGDAVVSPTQTTTYTATFAGPYGSVQCKTKIKVTPKHYDAPTCTLDANPGTIDQGQSSTLTWTTTNATSIAIDQGVGSVTPVVGGDAAVSPPVTTVYTGTAKGPGGEVQCATKVKVRPKVDAPTCTMSINPTSVAYNGAAVLTWTSTNATTATINQGVGSVAVNDSKPVSNLTTTTTYTGTFIGTGGTVICNATVTVPAPPVPACTLSLSKNKINPGESIKVSWTSANVSSGSISPLVGSASPVSAGASIDVYPSDDTTFTGTFTGPYGNVTCSAVVDVNVNIGCVTNCGGGGGFDPPTVTLFKKPTEQDLAFVYLSQVPYTGFEAGPALTLIFWLAVALASAMIAYFVTGQAGIRYLLGSAMTLAGVTNSHGRHDEYDEISGRLNTYGVDYPVEAVPSVNEVPVASPGKEFLVASAPIAVAPRPQAVMLPEPQVTHTAPHAVADGVPAIEDVIEARAHAAGVLMSPEAVVGAAALSSNRQESLSQFGTILNEAVRTIPREDGWVMLTSDRFEVIKGGAITSRASQSVSSSLSAPIALEEIIEPVKPTRALDVGEAAAAEFVTAILTRDRDTTYAIVRAMEHDHVSPTSLMTGVASVLDRLYRVRHGGKNGLDKNLLEASANVHDEAISKLVEIFTHALDTVYASPFTGVKLALAQAFEIVG